MGHTVINPNTSRSYLTDDPQSDLGSEWIIPGVFDADLASTGSGEDGEGSTDGGAGSHQPERRAFVHHAVQCPVKVSIQRGAVEITARIEELSLGGCRVRTVDRFQAGLHVPVELQFLLRSIGFRLLGVTEGNRGHHCFAVRFLAIPERRRVELAELLSELAQVDARKAAQQAVSKAAEDSSQSDAERGLSSAPSGSGVAVHNDAAELESLERRAHDRHGVQAGVLLRLLKSGHCATGRLLDLSQGGCCVRADEPQSVEAGEQAEIQFRVRGLPLRLGCTVQSIRHRQMLGAAFVEVSPRGRAQLTELMAEIAADAARR